MHVSIFLSQLYIMVAFSGPLRQGESRSYLIRPRRRRRVTSASGGQSAAPSNSKGGFANVVKSAVSAPSRTYNKAVDKALAVPRRRARTKTGRNQKGIVELAKQVRRLQLQRYGFVQNQYQYSVNAPLANIVPSINSAALFMVNDFYTQSPIYKGAIVAQESQANVAAIFINPTTDVDLNERWNFNLRNQQDTVSKVQYLPLTTRINVKWNTQGMNSGMAPITLRVSIFKFRKMPPQTTARNYVLPTALGSYNHLTDMYNPQNREFFNNRLHSVMHDRFITIRPTINSTTQSRNVTFDVKLPPRQLRPDVTDDPSGQSFWTNTDAEHQIWCLITSSFDTAQTAEGQQYYGLKQDLKITRYNVWQDQHGVSTI